MHFYLVRNYPNFLLFIICPVVENWMKIVKKNISKVHTSRFYRKKYQKDTPVCLHLYHAVVIQTTHKCAAIPSEYSLAQHCSNKSHCVDDTWYCGAFVGCLDGDCIIKVEGNWAWDLFY